MCPYLRPFNGQRLGCHTEPPLTCKNTMLQQLFEGIENIGGWRWDLDRRTKWKNVDAIGTPDWRGNTHSQFLYMYPAFQELGFQGGNLDTAWSYCCCVLHGNFWFHLNLILQVLKKQINRVERKHFFQHVHCQSPQLKLNSEHFVILVCISVRSVSEDEENY